MDDSLFLANAMILGDTQRQMWEQNQRMLFHVPQISSYRQPTFSVHRPVQTYYANIPKTFHSPEKSTFEEWEAVDKEHHLLSFVHVKVINDKSVLIEALWNEEVISKADFIHRIEQQILIALALGYTIQALPTNYPTKILFEEMGFSNPDESVANATREK